MYKISRAKGEIVNKNNLAPKYASEENNSAQECKSDRPDIKYYDIR